MIAPESLGADELFTHHPHPMYVFDLATLRLREVNEAACTAYRYPREQLLEMTLFDLRPPEDRTLLDDYVRSLQASTTDETTLWRYRRSDATTFYADVSSKPIIFDGRPARIVVAADATARLAVSRALSDSRTALAEAQQLAHLGSFELDLATGDMRWSAELFRIFAVDPARERPMLLHEFDHPDDAAAVASEVERARRERVPYTVEHRIRTRDGRERMVYERGRFYYEAGRDEPERVVGAVLDITERKEAEKRFRYLALHDALTGLANRTMLAERLDALIARSAAGGPPFAVLFVDVDRFKAINDTIAHAAGDRVLQELAARLCNLVPPDAIVSRPGGDEFIIAFDASLGEAWVGQVAQRLCDELARPVHDEGAELLVTASVGIALYPRDARTADELLSSADSAMYVAKGRGGNGVAAFRPELHARALHDVALERSLRLALERGDLDIAYQPIVDALTHAPVGCEALVRFHDGERSVAPNEFIPLAEATGLIVPLGAQVLERACLEAAKLVAAGHEPFAMCVNISARQFRDPNFIERVRRALELAQLDPKHLQLEITESAYVGAEAVFARVRTLADLGLGLSIDDFGTGYSSLGYLKRLPVETLKIDRSFVADILSDGTDQAIVRAIVAVAQNLGLDTIAEGVETLEQAQYLRQIGCSRLQGYVFARPLTPEALHAYFAAPARVRHVSWSS